jgi:hypothetical protein
MGDDPMALLGLEGALKHYYYYYYYVLRRLPCVLKVQVSIPARRMVPFFGAMALHCPSC